MSKHRLVAFLPDSFSIFTGLRLFVEAYTTCITKFKQDGALSDTPTGFNELDIHVFGMWEEADEPKENQCRNMEIIKYPHGKFATIKQLPHQLPNLQNLKFWEVKLDPKRLVS